MNKRKLMEFLEILEENQPKAVKVEILKNKFGKDYNDLIHICTKTFGLRTLIYGNPEVGWHLDQFGYVELKKLRDYELQKEKVEIDRKQIDLIRHAQTTSTWTKVLAIGTIIMAIAMIITSVFSVLSYNASIDKSPQLYISHQIKEDKILLDIVNQKENTATNIQIEFIVTNSDLTDEIKRLYIIPMLSKDTKQINFSYIPFNKSIEKIIAGRLEYFDSFEGLLNAKWNVSCENCQSEDIIIINKDFNMPFSCFRNINFTSCELENYNWIISS